MAFLFSIATLFRQVWALFPSKNKPYDRSHVKSRSCVGLRFGWLWTVLFCTLLRIGEASNPGPHDHFDADFTIGTFNPSGLRDKAPYFHTHMSYGDVWTMSETHFFGKDVSRFRAGLKTSKSMHRYCVTDSASVKKCLTSQTVWKGVGVLSKHPTRALPSSLPEDIVASGRALVFTTLLSELWMSGAVFYGEPNGHHYPAWQKNNEYILHHLAAHVCNLCSGPRFIAGDWNSEQDSLPAFGLLVQSGFRDIQDIALERWGIPIQTTCKGRTRKDFLYISPELQDLLMHVDVVHDVWPDHSILVGRFRSLLHLPPMWVWPAPDAIPWPQECGAHVQWPTVVHNVDEAYSQLWEQIEADAARKCPFPLKSKMMGRARRTAPRKIRSQVVTPVKMARKGDFQPEYFGPSVKHAQWIRQARRLQAFSRMATNPSAALAIAKAEAWGAILRAPGFDGSFSMWWQSCTFKTAGAPVVCPIAPPDHVTAVEMFESVSGAVRDLEKSLKQRSRQYAKFRRDQNPNLVFTDIKAPMVPGVDVLLQPIRATVADVHVDQGMLVLDRACEFYHDEVISCKGVPLQLIHHEADALWVENAGNIQVGDVISQTHFVGTHSELEKAFLDAWRERWMRHAEVPASRWDAIVNFAHRFMPRATLAWDPMQASDLSQIVQSKKKSTSQGFDGVSLADLTCMPPQVNHAFCQMFEFSEATGQWPSQLVNGKVVSLAKVTCPRSPADFRPITVFSLLYRIWGSYHSRRALALLDKWLPDTLYGSRPGRYAGQVWSKLLWSIEHAFQHSVDLSGMVADLQKAFNMIPRLAVFEIAGHVRIPGNVLVGWAGALSQMTRRFLLRGSLTAGLRSVTGFPEGCGLSCVAMVLVDAAFHKSSMVQSVLSVVHTCFLC